MQTRLRLSFATALLLLLACGDATPPAVEIDRTGPTSEWRNVGGGPGGIQYSPLTQITADNVGSLEVAWTYHHGDISDGSDGTTRTSFNATPIVVGDSLYFCTGKNRVIALDAETGAERWTFDPKPKLARLNGPYPRVCRGVAYWEGPELASGATCGSRIFTEIGRASCRERV